MQTIIQGFFMTMQDAKRGFVTDAAIELFLKKPIAAVTIRDVAAASGVGEATIYRYFSNRANLLVACAVKLQAEVGREFLSPVQTDGLGKIAHFYGTYLAMFRVRPELYRFLSDFDAYCISEGITEMEEYQDNFDRFREAFLAFYREGVADGSVRELDDPELFYSATTHAMLSLCKKLAAESRIVRQDAAIDPGAEIKTLTRLILDSVKKK